MPYRISLSQLELMNTLPLRVEKQFLGVLKNRVDLIVRSDRLIIRFIKTELIVRTLQLRCLGLENILMLMEMIFLTNKKIFGKQHCY